jgi:serine/threonine-protein phosphatase 6 regulatory ankyrin repeat subunit A/serine/threonine-protein phosphatase 6 regulatory ankyrin repeat subunit B
MISFFISIHNIRNNPSGVSMSSDQTPSRSEDIQLMGAIGNNNPESVRILLSRGADINYRGKHGETPLIKAMLCEDPRICRILLDAGADVNLATMNGYSPLTFACLQNNFEYVRMLCGHHAEISCRTQEGLTPLIIASTNSSVFFDNMDHPFFHDLIEIVFKYAHYHPDYDPVRVVNMLLDYGADPNESNLSGTTPLMAAAGMANYPILKLLIARKSDVSLEDTEGKTALMYAVISSIDGLIDNLIHMRLVTDAVRLSDFMTPRMFAQLRPRFEPQKEQCVNYLINNGADIRAKDKRGISVLTHAARAGNLNVVKNLVGHGADLHERSIRGITALYAAAINGHNDIVEFLHSQGADIDVRMDDGETPLMAAVWNGQVETVALLIHKGADVNAKKYTPYKPSGESSIVWVSNLDRTEKNENYDKIFQLLAKSGAV